MTPNDPLYYPRLKLAERLVNSLSDGIAHAFTLFAPRRMGKTQFLLNDVVHVAKEKGFRVFYFSFMDIDEATVTLRFQQSLTRFAAELTTAEKAKSLLSSIDKISFMGASISRDGKRNTTSMTLTTSDIIDTLAETKFPVLLLLDEVQELAKIDDAKGLIRSLRTGLDMNKAQVKVIFTGSSMMDLQALFNDSKAPFFHFAHDIELPTLDRSFTDHLAEIIVERTQTDVDKNALYQAFEAMSFTPMYLRSVAQDLILDPNLSLADAVSKRLAQFNDTGKYDSLWQSLNALDQAILVVIHKGETALYSQTVRDKLGQHVGTTITSSQVQKSTERLSKKDILNKDIRGNWLFTEQAFKSWLAQHV